MSGGSCLNLGSEGPRKRRKATQFEAGSVNSECQNKSETAAKPAVRKAPRGRGRGKNSGSSVKSPRVPGWNPEVSKKVAVTLTKGSSLLSRKGTSQHEGSSKSNVLHSKYRKKCMWFDEMRQSYRDGTVLEHIQGLLVARSLPHCEMPLS